MSRLAPTCFCGWMPDGARSICSAQSVLKLSRQTVYAMTTCTGRRGIAPHFLNRSTIWRWLNERPGHFTPGVRTPIPNEYRCRVGSKRWSGHFGQEKNVSCLHHPAHNLVTTPTELLQLPLSDFGNSVYWGTGAETQKLCQLLCEQQQTCELTGASNSSRLKVM